MSCSTCMELIWECHLISRNNYQEFFWNEKIVFCKYRHFWLSIDFLPFFFLFVINSSLRSFLLRPVLLWQRPPSRNKNYFQTLHFNFSVCLSRRLIFHCRLLLAWISLLQKYMAKYIFAKNNSSSEKEKNKKDSPENLLGCSEYNSWF